MSNHSSEVYQAVDPLQYETAGNTGHVTHLTYHDRLISANVSVIQFRRLHKSEGEGKS